MPHTRRNAHSASSRPQPVRRAHLRAALKTLAAVVVTAAMLTGAVACSAAPAPTTAAESTTTQPIAPSATSQETSPMPQQQPSSSTTPIRIVIGDATVTAELWDNAPGRALLERLPVTLTFSDLNAVEKTARLDPGLPMTGMPDGDDPAPRDIGWYAPSNDVVLYYGDVGYWPGIARIGQISDGIDLIADQQGDFTATIEPAT